MTQMTQIKTLGIRNARPLGRTPANAMIQVPSVSICVHLRLPFYLRNLRLRYLSNLYSTAASSMTSAGFAFVTTRASTPNGSVHVGPVV
jgi:hypothetical protein